MENNMKLSEEEQEQVDKLLDESPTVEQLVEEYSDIELRDINDKINHPQIDELSVTERLIAKLIPVAKYMEELRDFFAKNPMTEKIYEDPEVESLGNKIADLYEEIGDISEDEESKEKKKIITDLSEKLSNLAEKLKSVTIREDEDYPSEKWMEGYMKQHKDDLDSLLEEDDLDSLLNDEDEYFNLDDDDFDDSDEYEDDDILDDTFYGDDDLEALLREDD